MKSESIIGIIVILLIGFFIYNFFLKNVNPVNSKTSIQSKIELEAIPYGGSFIPNYIYRFEDKEKGVICWAFQGDKAGGLSCIPKKSL
jgi:hypothetical protein